MSTTMTRPQAEKTRPQAEIQRPRTETLRAQPQPIPARTRRGRRAERRTAYHQAGHALVAHLVGLVVGEVTILERHNRTGSCEVSGNGCVWA